MVTRGHVTCVISSREVITCALKKFSIFFHHVPLSVVLGLTQWSKILPLYLTLNAIETSKARSRTFRSFIIISKGAELYATAKQ